MSFLAHKNWSGLGGLAALIGLPIAGVAAWVGIMQLRASVQIKSLEVHETGRTYLGDFPGGQHSYLIYFALVNTGNTPIDVRDWVDKPAVMTPPFQTISAVTSTNPYGLTEYGASSSWSSTNNRDWFCEPFVLNPNQKMGFLINFTPQPFDYNKPDFDPKKYDPEKVIRWRFNVVGLTSFKFIRDVESIPTLNYVAVSVFGCGFMFYGVYTWIFFILGCALYGAGMFRLLKKFKREQVWLIFFNSILLFYLSFAFAEVLIFVLNYNVVQLAYYAYGVVAAYVFYVFFLFHKKARRKRKTTNIEQKEQKGTGNF